MAVIKPFRAVRYNDTLLKNAGSVVAPPYDVISEEQLEFYYDQSPCNIVRLILGKEFPDDNDGNNRYTRARDFISLWLKKGTLVNDSMDSIYGYSQTFEAPSGDTVTRSGFVALVELSDWGEKGIFPHEMTNLKPKSDRLTLAKTTGFSLSFIFSLYLDSVGDTRDLLKEIVGGRELAGYTDGEGVMHSLTVCDDEEVHRSLVEAFKGKQVFVADGHHRYETALALKEEMEREGVKSDRLSYAMMYFCPMEGEGVVILPAHRVVALPGGFDRKGFLEEVGRYFEVEKVTNGAEGGGELLSMIKRKEKGSFGCCLGGRDIYIFTLRDPGSIAKFFPPEMNDKLKGLDVTILRSGVVEGIMGIKDPEITYTKDYAEAMKMTEGGDRIAFLINPTKMEDVREVSLMGEKMPQKSTYFYPKVSSGLLLYDVLELLKS